MPIRLRTFIGAIALFILVTIWALVAMALSLCAAAQVTKLNGAVERCNQAWRYEFYSVYDLPRNMEAINPILDACQHLYNHHRPHGALGGLSPAQYLAKLKAKDTSLSQGC